MLHILFGGLIGASLIYGLITGNGDKIIQSMLDAAGDGVSSVLSMAGGFAFFCGMIAILRKAGALERLSRLLSPLLRLLMGKDIPEKALEYVTMNLCANFLGMGNAATPMGIQAAKYLARGEAAGNALCLFLVMNAASIEILPASVIALRSAAGSADPGAVTIPTLLATGISFVIGVISCKIMEKRA